VAALGNIGSLNAELVEDAIPKIRKIMKTATDVDVKMNAKVALGRLGDAEAL
jgi:HEAT repeat protein